MKKLVAVVLAITTMLSFSSCKKGEVVESKPEIAQMRTICELATLKCYYHNVAKYNEKNVEGFLWWKKDLNFWVEYSGIVKVGVDFSQLDVDINDDEVTITIPKAKVLNISVDSASLTEDSFIVADKSAQVKVEYQQQAIKDAQENMKKTAEKNPVVLSNALERAKDLIIKYINNLGDLTGKEYKINWKYIENDGSSTTSDVSSQTTSENVSSSDSNTLQAEQQTTESKEEKSSKSDDTVKQ